ncbi:MAG: peptidylprolyl isomerase [Flavobacteriaceae bacterium]|nr:MAG: peptidylprolyl isomerase [Flavobacteriaceae bacterium]
MAILSKIRERSAALIIIIGLALFAFVVDPSTLTDFFDSSKVDEVGIVNGEIISGKEYAEALETYRVQTGNRVSEMQAAQTIWDNLLRKKIYKEQLNKAGVTLGEEDIWQEIVKENSGVPQFLNEAGLFDEEKLKQYVTSIKEAGGESAVRWQEYVNGVVTRLEIATYNKLISGGLGASLKEAEIQYMMNYTKLNGDYVYLPFTSIPDSTVTVSKSDIESYIKAHRAEFEVAPSRSISYVKFAITPSQEDEVAIKNEVAALLEDRKEPNNVTNQTETLSGLRNTDDIAIFFEDNKSDIPLDTTYKFKKDISVTISDEIFEGNTGDTFGPYKENEHYKITKIIAITKIPDSVKASHILISHIGAARASAEVTKTETQAKITADSILKVVRKDKSKFEALAKEFSTDKSNSDTGGSLGKFDYKRMVPEFRDYAFSGKKGNIGVVKTAFGYHVIKIEDQNKPQKVVKLATYVRKIEASEETENKVFQNSEEFALELAKDTKINDAAKTKGYEVIPSVGLKVLDEDIARLGKERQIVKWAFDKETKIGSYKRFEVNKGHVVAVLTAANEEGLPSAASVTNRVKPILLKEAKATLLKAKMNGASLSEIAESNHTTVKTIANASLNTPSITGIGTEPNVLGAMYHSEPNKLYTKIVGDKGIFAFVLKKKEPPTTLPNYDTNRNKIADSRKNQTSNIYEAIKNASDIEDNRAAFYGVN